MAASIADMIQTIEDEGDKPAFPKIAKKDIIDGIRERLKDASKVNQLKSSLCGPSSVMYSLLRTSSKQDVYVRYVADLYLYGTGHLGTMAVKPGSDCKNYKPTKDKIHPVDWVALASLTDSENDAFDYDSVDCEAGGITMPEDLSRWFGKCGYGTRNNVTNLVFCKGESDIKEALRLTKLGNNVCLFINAYMMYDEDYEKESNFPNHWVVMQPTSKITKDEIECVTYSWGTDTRKVPKSKGKMKISTFCENFYGYVTAA